MQKKSKKKDRVVSPGLEPGTFSVLARNHDQLDHETKVKQIRVVSPGLEPGTFSVLARNHDQLDHETEWRISVVSPGLEPGTFSVLARNHDQLDHETIYPDWLTIDLLFALKKGSIAACCWE